MGANHYRSEMNLPFQGADQNTERGNLLNSAWKSEGHRASRKQFVHIKPNWMPFASLGLFCNHFGFTNNPDSCLSENEIRKRSGYFGKGNWKSEQKYQGLLR